VKRVFEDSDSLDCGPREVNRTDMKPLVPPPPSGAGWTAKILQKLSLERARKLDQLINKLRKGNYRVDSKRISLKILEDFINDRMARRRIEKPFIEC
jgi:hypothetical protein